MTRDPVRVGDVLPAVVDAIAPGVLPPRAPAPRLCSACADAGRAPIALRESWNAGELRCVWCGHTEAR